MLGVFRKHLADARSARLRAVGVITSVCIGLQICVSRKSAISEAFGFSEFQFNTWWSLSQLVFFFLIPALCARFLWNLSPLDLGAALPARWSSHAKHYAALLIIGLSAAVVASRSQSFRWFYPICHDAAQSWRMLFAWEAIYATQFFALEFFFRGFLLRAVEPELGSGAIFFSLPLYVLFHLGKPMPEVFASIFAGTALGTLALASRSIWGGVIVHVCVAWFMDVLALVVSHRLPRFF